MGKCGDVLALSAIAKISEALVTIPLICCTVKKVDEVVRNPHLVTQDQFSLVSEKASGILEGNFTINIKLFLQTFTNVELLRQNWIVSLGTSPRREPKFSDLVSYTLPRRHTLFLIQVYIEGNKRRNGAISLLFTLYLYFT